MTLLPPPRQPVLRVTTTTGRVTVTAEARGDIQVSDGVAADRTATQTTATTTSQRVDVRVPTGTDVIIGTTSGRIAVRGSVGRTSITTESGKISVDDAVSLDVRSITGAIDIGHCGTDCCLRSATGAVAVGSCGQIDAATTTGKIALREVRGPVRAHCTNGRVDIILAGAHDVDAETVTGRISVSLPPGVRAALVDATLGESPLPHPADCTVSTRSITGRVDVVQR